MATLAWVTCRSAVTIMSSVLNCLLNTLICIPQAYERHKMPATLTLQDEQDPLSIPYLFSLLDRVVSCSKSTLDLYKLDLDLWDCFGRKSPFL